MRLMRRPPRRRVRSVAHTFADLDGLAYASLFPESLTRLRQWYSLVWHDASLLVPQLQRRLLEELQQAPAHRMDTAWAPHELRVHCIVRCVCAHA